jgi:hypothetical protein
MQEKDRTALAEKIAEAICEMIEKERGLVKSRLVETIATILSAPPKEAQAYERMKQTLFEKPKTFPSGLTAYAVQQRLIEAWTKEEGRQVRQALESLREAEFFQSAWFHD